MIERLKGYVRDMSQPGTMGRVAAHYARRIPLWLGVGFIGIGVIGCIYVISWAISGNPPEGTDPTMSRQDMTFSFLGYIGLGVFWGILGYALIAREKNPRYNLWHDFVARARSLILAIRGRRGQSARPGAEGPGADASRSTSHQQAESIQAEQTLRLRLPQQSQQRRVAAVTDEKVSERTGLSPDKVHPIANMVREILYEQYERDRQEQYKRDRQQQRRDIWLLAVGAVVGVVLNMLTAPMGRLFGS